MYRRFLNNSDYLGIITQEALQQLTRGNDERFIQAEESAEMSIVEYLSENYEVEKEFAKGKYIADYDRRITYPVGVHIYFDGQIHEVIRSISGYRMPATVVYWEESTDINIDASLVPTYSQINTYYPGNKVNYNGVVYLCLSENGYKFDDIRIPMVGGWIEADTTQWQPIDYPLWAVVEYEGAFYTLTFAHAAFLLCKSMPDSKRPKRSGSYTCFSAYQCFPPLPRPPPCPTALYFLKDPEAFRSAQDNHCLFREASDYKKNRHRGQPCFLFSASEL